VSSRESSSRRPAARARRVGFAIAAFLDADVLLLDEVFAVGDEAFQRKCFGRIFAFKQAGGTIVFVSHDAAAVERLCERSVFLESGRVAFDGPTREAVTRYRRALADEASPAELSVGLREWGSGEVAIVSAALVGQEGSDRLQFLSGEPFELQVAVATRDGVPPPRRSTCAPSAGLRTTASGAFAFGWGSSLSQKGDSTFVSA
jgi:hypothetical protein